MFCIYIDDILLQLSASGVGCFVGLNFDGALAYADDIVLLAPTPFAMRKMLKICDTYASAFDIIFNAEKSKFLVVAAYKHRQFYNEMCSGDFFVGDKIIENVSKYAHLGHIITSSFSNIDDINNRRNCFVGQVNNLLCYFNQLDLLVKIKLFKSYCSSIYGCELWALNSENIDIFCIAWRKAIRRILNLPNTTHSFFLPPLSNTLPVYDELCKRSARFIISCLFSVNQLVQSVASYSVMHARYNSLLGSNALLCSKRFGWSLVSYTSNLVSLNNSHFEHFYLNSLSDSERTRLISLMELILLREGHLTLPRDHLSISQISDMVSVVATA